MKAEFTREDYEHAARAAGLTIRDSTRWMDTIVKEIKMDDGSTNAVRWDPVDDYGDALRLSEAAGIDLHYDHSTAICTAINPVTGQGFDDRIAPVAIFRAAIEIGKIMKGTP